MCWVRPRSSLKRACIFADADIWTGPSSGMYRPDCGHSERHLGGLTCLSLTGWLFTIIFTYMGFAFMLAGELTLKLVRIWVGVLELPGGCL